jgi:pseudaminic acid biosynthesis-associated methylase
MSCTRFWAGEFGTAYTMRNQVDPASRAPFFRYILGLTGEIKRICELGANRGHNLVALQRLNPRLELTGVEVNSAACTHLATLEGITAIWSSIQDFETEAQYDLVFTCGVLIHIGPEDLRATYAKMARLSSRYVLMNEYFNPVPVELNYRGHSGKLFKRDFAGEFLDQNRNWQPVGYGFLWKRVEPAWDNTTWTLMEKL